LSLFTGPKDGFKKCWDKTTNKTQKRARKALQGGAPNRAATLGFNDVDLIMHYG